MGAVDYKREQKFFYMIAEGLADTFEPSSAWTFSRIGGGMIDEYIVDYEEYVGLGSGAFSFLDGAMYCETFSLRDYGAALDAGRQGVVAWRQFAKREQMRYRFLMELFGLRMDKRKFERDFGGSPDRLLPLEMTFMRAAGGFATDTPEEATLTLTGPVPHGGAHARVLRGREQRSRPGARRAHHRGTRPALRRPASPAQQKHGARRGRGGDRDRERRAAAGGTAGVTGLAGADADRDAAQPGGRAPSSSWATIDGSDPSTEEAS